MCKDEYTELEEMRREMAEAADMTTPESLLGKIFRWCLRRIEREQKDIINERFGR